MIESGVADVYERLVQRLNGADLGIDDAQLHEAVDTLLDHRAKVEAFSGPMLVLHARSDTLGAARARRASRGMWWTTC